MAPLKAHVPTLPLQNAVESKAGKRDFKNTWFLFFIKKNKIRQNIAFKGFLKNIFNFCV